MIQGHDISCYEFRCHSVHGLYTLLGVRELQKSGRAVNAEALGCLKSLDKVCVGDAFAFTVEKSVELVCKNCGIFNCAVSAMAADRVELRDVSVW